MQSLVKIILHYLGSLSSWNYMDKVNKEYIYAHFMPLMCLWNSNIQSIGSIRITSNWSCLLIAEQNDELLMVNYWAKWNAAYDHPFWKIDENKQENVVSKNNSLIQKSYFVTIINHP